MRNLVVVLLGVVSLGAAVLYRVTEIKWNKEDYIHIHHLSEREVPAYRGNIYDNQGEILATSLPFYEASIDLGLNNDHLFNRHVDSLAHCLSRHIMTHKTKSRIKKELIRGHRKDNHYYKISNRLSYSDYKKLKSMPLLREGRFVGGLVTHEYFDRMRPFGDIGRRTIGFTTADSTAYRGLEKSYDSLLRGKSGLRLMQRVNEKQWLPVSSENLRDPEAGKHIVTTINMAFQEILHNELEKALKLHGAESGTAALMEVETGDIKAMASLSEIAKGKYREIMNLSVEDGGDPGSTFKAASVLAILEDQKVDITDTVYTHGGSYKIHDLTIRDDKKLPDSLALIDAFALSSNATIASMIEEHYHSDPGAFYKHLEAFGLTEKMEVPLEREVAPTVKNPAKDKGDWYLTTLPMMAFGYEMRLTPLHILNFYNGIANGGVLMKPRLVSSILDSEGRVFKEIPPKILNEHMAHPSAIERIHKCLQRVVVSGTAASDRVRTICDFAGKTGTVQLNYSEVNHKSELEYAGSFAGYFPREKPKYTLLVKIVKPKDNKIYGAQVALPTFKHILNLVMSTEVDQMQLADTLKENEDLLIANVYQRAGRLKDFEDIWKYLGIPDELYSKAMSKNDEFLPDNVVPDVRQMGLRDALYLLENRGLEVRIKGHGKVVRQSIAPGTPAEGQSIQLVLS